MVLGRFWAESKLKIHFLSIKLTNKHKKILYKALYILYIHEIYLRAY